MIYLVIYLAGVLITLTILKYFGKKLMGDYDEPKDYSSMDDWNSNASAYSAWAFCWFIVLPAFLMMGLWTLWVKFIKWFIK